MQHIVISCCHIYMMDHRDGRVIFSRGGTAIIISIPQIQYTLQTECACLERVA